MVMGGVVAVTIDDLCEVFILVQHPSLMILNLGPPLGVSQLLLVHLGFALGALPFELDLVYAFLRLASLMLHQLSAFLGLVGLALEKLSALFGLTRPVLSRMGTVMLIFGFVSSIFLVPLSILSLMLKYFFLSPKLFSLSFFF